jgi:outer membrane biosynthesis protein TonB
MAGPDGDRSIHAQLEHDRAEREVQRRREWRRRLVGSFVGHGLALGLVAYAPAPEARPMPAVVTVDLIAAPRPKAPAGRPQSGARAEPAPAPAPPPPPAQKTVVLPREAPEAKAKPVPKKEKKKAPVRPPRRPRPKELDYDDALAKLREELGEPEASPTDEPEAPGEAAGEAAEAPVESTGSGGAGMQVSPEVARWIKETIRHVRATYVTPPEFRGRGLRACVTVLLTADGRIVGEPRMQGSSGDVYWDDNAVRATMRASPLPAPPEEGDWTFCFPTEESE